MNKQQAILAKVKSLKAQLKELEQMLRTGNDTYTIIAGWSQDSILTGLIDLDGFIAYSGPKSLNDKNFEELSSEEKFKIISRGVFQAIKMVPVSVLDRYLADDGPQIKLKLSNPEVFNWASKEKSYAEETKELADTMIEHIKNYRIKIELLFDDEFSELMED